MQDIESIMYAGIRGLPKVVNTHTHNAYKPYIVYNIILCGIEYGGFAFFVSQNLKLCGIFIIRMMLFVL